MKRLDINKLKDYFNLRDDLIAAYVFGSSAANRSGSGSDLDIAVLLAENVPEKDYGFIKEEIITAVVELLSFNEIDLVVLNTASPLLCHEVLKKGVLCFLGDEEKRIEFTVKATMRYLDTAYLRSVQDRIIHERIKRGSFGYFTGSHKYSIEKVR
ncbi:MAG: nucleotidyltransferase domain-containing protein [Nitrospirota bacterium]